MACEPLPKYSSVIDLVHNKCYQKPKKYIFEVQIEPIHTYALSKFKDSDTVAKKKKKHIMVSDI